MRGQAVFPGATRYTLRHALLIYRPYGGAGTAYVTVHPVGTVESGPPSIGPGKPADLAFLRGLSEELQTAVPPEVLPEHVLTRTPDTIAWWSAPSRRPMHFRERSELEGVSGQLFPHPALVWKVDGQSLKVRALKQAERPTAETELFTAPYWNTSSDGRVCTGDMRRPDHTAVDSLREWEAGYFGSLFTHASGGGKMTKKKGGVVALWKSHAGRERFNTRLLESAGETLGEFVKGGRRGRA